MLDTGRQKQMRAPTAYFEIDPDSPPVQLNYGFCQEQSQTGAFRLTAGIRSAVEAVKNIRRIIGIDSGLHH